MTNKILNLRGTSGAGKSFPLHKLIAAADSTTIEYGEDGKIKAHQIFIGDLRIFAIGSYLKVCGGTDTIKTQDEICDLVRWFIPYGHVIFEGLLLSHLYSRYVSLDEEMYELGHKFIWLYLDTPLPLCLKRVKQRRAERGNDKPFNPQNTIKHHFQTFATFKKARRDGYDARILHHDRAFYEIISILYE